MFSAPAPGSVKLWLPSGSCQLGGYDGESGFTPERNEVMPFQVEDGDTADLTLKLSTALSEFCQTIAGIVVGIEGEPMPGVWVSLNPRTARGAYVGQYTDETGRFEFSARPGSYDLSLHTGVASRCDVSGYAGGSAGEQAVIVVEKADIAGLRVLAGGEPLESVGWMGCQFAGPQSRGSPWILQRRATLPSPMAFAWRSGRDVGTQWGPGRHLRLYTPQRGELGSNLTRAGGSTGKPL